MYSYPHLYYSLNSKQSFLRSKLSDDINIFACPHLFRQVLEDERPGVAAHLLAAREVIHQAADCFRKPQQNKRSVPKRQENIVPLRFGTLELYFSLRRQISYLLPFISHLSSLIFHISYLIFHISSLLSTASLMHSTM